MFSSVADLAKIASLVFRDNVPFGSRPDQILDGATLRETLLPRYITPDREGGYGMTWELYRVGDYMIRTKRGDVEGYASELILVPELKLGIVVLASIVEHAQATAQTLTGLLLPAFDSHFRSLGPATSAPSPLDVRGTYRPNLETLPTLHVTETNGVLYFDWIPSTLEYLGTEETNDGDEFVFRLLPWPGMGAGPAAATCTRTQSDDWWNLVKFRKDGDGGVALTADVAYGALWRRE